MALEILYKDEYLVAINKPHGLLVHKSPIARDATEFAVQMLKDELGIFAYPAHRLDRKTGGVLLFSLSKDFTRQAQQLFADRAIQKKYLAIVRGYTEDQGEIDYPLKKDNGVIQEAFTKYRTLARAELEVPFGQHQTVRYSLVEAAPETGRMHQLRKHFAHILHPIIGDRPYGCNKQNKLFKERWNMDTMMLHASSLKFKHPFNQSEINIQANLHSEFKRIMKLMDWEL